jgi:hypothetical protein
VHFKKCKREKEEAEGWQLYEKDMLDRAWATLAGNVIVMSLQGQTMHSMCQGDSVDSRCSVIQLSDTTTQ